MKPFTIVGIGEALFDLFPDGRELLGGAPALLVDLGVSPERVRFERFGPSA